MDYPGNSHTQREAPAKEAKRAEPKKVEKVVEGEVTRRKKPLGKRFREAFVGEDSKGVMNYVLIDVLVPAAKDMVADAATTAVERTLFGQVRSAGRRGGRGSSPNGYVSYNSMSRGPLGARREEPRQVSRRARSSHDFDEIILNTRGEAEEVIDRLFDLVSRYESATVADLYELTGITGSYTDEKYGWTDIRGAGVTRVRSGYLLDLPRPELLD